MGEGGNSPWVWIGCGCAALIGFGIVAIGGVAFFGVRTAKTMADPEKRHEKALEVLQATALPDGYEVELAVSMPLVPDFVVLEGLDGKFVFMHGLRTRGDLKQAMQDDDSFDREVRAAGLRVRRGTELVDRGSLRPGPGDVRYAIYDGDIDFDASGNAGRTRFDFDDDDDDEISAVMLVRCSDDRTPGLLLWSGPRAAVAEEGDSAQADPAADRVALESRLQQFGFCG